MSDVYAMYAMYPAHWAEPDPEYPAPKAKAPCNEICAEVAALKAADMGFHHIDEEQESKR